jgi:threonylcarbamoyladenosine tRNA methylthiotransferase MtaB
MKEQINGIVKSYRVNELLKLNDQLATQFIESSDTVSVLFEKADERYMYGHSDTYIYIKVDKDESLLNEIVDVKITKHEYKNTEGIILKK